jgi:hypothetical protein
MPALTDELKREIGQVSLSVQANRRAQCLMMTALRRWVPWTPS